VITYKSELSRIKEGNEPKPVYWLAANLPYIEKQIIDTIGDRLGGKTLSVKNISVEEIDPVEFESIICSGNLLSGGVLVVATDAKKIKGDKGKRLIESLKRIAPGNVVIFTEADIPKNTSLGKYLATEVCVITETGIDLNTIRRWINKRVSTNDCHITKDAIELLIDHTMGDMATLSSELDKLTAFVGKDETITSAIIKSIIPKKKDLIIFQVLDALADRNIAQSIQYIHELIVNGEPPERALVMIYNHFMKVLLAGKLTSEKMSQQQIASKLSCHPFVAKKAIAASKRFDSRELMTYLKQIQDADIAVKTGKSTAMFALETALFQFIN